MWIWPGFELRVALRFLREGRMQTAFIIGGVAIGVAVIVFMSELLLGLQGNFIRRVLTGQAHIQLLPPKEAARQLPAAPGEQAEPLYERFCERLGAKKGVFGACMGVALINDGPVTVMLEA